MQAEGVNEMNRHEIRDDFIAVGAAVGALIVLIVIMVLTHQGAI